MNCPHKSQGRKKKTGLEKEKCSNSNRGNDDDQCQKAKMNYANRR
jgi:hypothetical protein